ncbi:MAG: hypothetical protein ABIJ15_09250 [bacterium]
MGKCYFNSSLSAGCFSFALSEKAGKTEFVPGSGLGEGLMPFRLDEISVAVISWLQGRGPDFLKNITEKEDEALFFFSRNKYALKKMTVRTFDGRLAGIALFFKKGFAEIEIMDIVYAEN